jgi:hypothetical protein
LEQDGQRYSSEGKPVGNDPAEGGDWSFASGISQVENLSQRKRHERHGGGSAYVPILC